MVALEVDSVAGAAPEVVRKGVSVLATNASSEVNALESAMEKLSAYT